MSTVDTPTLLQMESRDPKGHLWPVPTSRVLFLPDGQTDGRTEGPLLCVVWGVWLSRLGVPSPSKGTADQTPPRQMKPGPAPGRMKGSLCGAGRRPPRTKPPFVLCGALAVGVGTGVPPSPASATQRMLDPSQGPRCPPLSGKEAGRKAVSSSAPEAFKIGRGCFSTGVSRWRERPGAPRRPVSEAEWGDLAGARAGGGGGGSQDAQAQLTLKFWTPGNPHCLPTPSPPSPGGSRASLPAAHESRCGSRH